LGEAGSHDNLKVRDFAGEEGRRILERRGRRKIDRYP